MGHRGPSASAAPSVGQVSSPWGHLTSAGGMLSPHAVTGRSNTTSLVSACEAPLLGDHPPHCVSSRFLIIRAPKQEAD